MRRLWIHSLFTGSMNLGNNFLSLIRNRMGKISKATNLWARTNFLLVCPSKKNNSKMVLVWVWNTLSWWKKSMRNIILKSKSEWKSMSFLMTMSMILNHSKNGIQEESMSWLWWKGGKLIDSCMECTRPNLLLRWNPSTTLMTVWGSVGSLSLRWFEILPWKG